MDQMLFAALGLAMAALFGAGYFIGMSERDSRASRMDAQSGPDDVEKRSRRAF